MTIGECRIIQVLLGIRTSNDPQGLKKTHLVFLCDTAWPQYPLEDSEQWPVGGSLKYNTVLQLDRFCKEQGKWVEVAYVLPFYSLRNMPDLCPKVPLLLKTVTVATSKEYVLELIS